MLLENALLLVGGPRLVINVERELRSLPFPFRNCRQAWPLGVWIGRELPRQRVADHQPQPDALRILIGRVLQFAERVKQLRLVLNRYAQPRVADGQLCHLVVGDLAADSDHSIGGELHRVAEQVYQNLPDLHWVAVDVGGDATQLDLEDVLLEGSRDAHDLARVLDQRVQVDLLDVQLELPGVHDRDVEEVLHHVQEAVQLAHNRADELLDDLFADAGLDRLNHQLDRLQRGPELVREIPEEVGLLLDLLLKLRDGVERGDVSDDEEQVVFEGQESHLKEFDTGFGRVLAHHLERLHGWVLDEVAEELVDRLEAPL